MPFFVHGVLCLVKLVNARFLSLRISVKYDSSLISFGASWQVNSFKISANYFLCSYNFHFLKKLVMQLQFRIFSEIFSYAATVFFPELVLHKYSVAGRCWCVLAGVLGLRLVCSELISFRRMNDFQGNSVT